jgi:hypothetical protein
VGVAAGLPLSCQKLICLLGVTNSGFILQQAMLHPDYRKRPIAEAVLNHRFISGAVLRNY